VTAQGWKIDSSSKPRELGIGPRRGGNNQVFPASLRGSPLLFVPVLAVLVLMIFWLCRVRFTSAYKKFERISGIAGPQTLTAVSE
jgi:hypothetical protein